jgi:hypothetical protein
MQNRLVPRTEWYRFFADFSRRHEGALATVRVLHPQLGSQVEARGLPLEGIVSPADARGPISILLGRTSDANLEHEIGEPRQVWVEQSGEGSEEALAVISEDGTRTIVEFAAPRPLRDRPRVPIA